MARLFTSGILGWLVPLLTIFLHLSVAALLGLQYALLVGFYQRTRRTNVRRACRSCASTPCRRSEAHQSLLHRLSFCVRECMPVHQGGETTELFDSYSMHLGTSRVLGRMPIALSRIVPSIDHHSASLQYFHRQTRMLRSFHEGGLFNA